MKENILGSIANNRYIQEMEIGGLISEIKNNTFKGVNSNLTKVDMSNNKIITTLYDDIFRNCTLLKIVSLPINFTSINQKAFENCSNLTSIEIPSSVTSIGSYAFEGCYRLVEIYNLSTLNIIAGSENYGYIAKYAKIVHTSLDEPSKLITSNGVVYYVDETSKIAVGPTDINATSVTIDNDCTEINQSAFYNCSSLTSIEIPSSVTSIGDWALFACNNLTNIIFEENSQLTNIGEDVFSNCSSLTNITIPSSVTSIG